MAEMEETLFAGWPWRKHPASDHPNHHGSVELCLFMKLDCDCGRREVDDQVCRGDP